jgi:hypothetical protein
LTVTQKQKTCAEIANNQCRKIQNLFMRPMLCKTSDLSVDVILYLLSQEVLPENRGLSPQSIHFADKIITGQPIIFPVIR